MNITQNLRPLASTLALLAALGLSGCKTMDIGTVIEHSGNILRAHTKTVSPQEEQQMGDESAALLLGAAPLVKNPGLQRHVNQVGQWLAQQTGRSDIKWRFGVIDTDNVNAFAAPAGYVFVTRGLLERLDNEAELAGVMAHEISHVIMGHYVETMLKQDQGRAWSEAANAAAANRGADAAKYIINTARGVYSAGLDKSDEYQADRMGVVIAARAGYDPFGLPRVLQMYAASSGQSGFDLLFSTHPAADDRLDKLASAMGDKFDALESKGIKNTAAFSRLTANLSPKRR